MLQITTCHLIDCLWQSHIRILVISKMTFVGLRDGHLPFQTLPSAISHMAFTYLTHVLQTSHTLPSAFLYMDGLQPYSTCIWPSQTLPSAKKNLAFSYFTHGLSLSQTWPLAMLQKVYDHLIHCLWWSFAYASAMLHTGFCNLTYGMWLSHYRHLDTSCLAFILS